jgi:hypothetical protein
MRSTVQYIAVRPPETALPTRIREIAEVRMSYGYAGDVLAYLQFPATNRRPLHSTNPLERLNDESSPPALRDNHLHELMALSASTWGSTSDSAGHLA